MTSYIWKTSYISSQIPDEPYLNKATEDYDLIETICDNDQATAQHTIQFGSRIGIQVNDDIVPEGFFPAKHVHDMSFGEGSAYGNASPLIHI